MKRSHKTREGLSVHSFGTLLANPAVRSRVTYEFKAGGVKVNCQQVPEPTPLHARVYDLICAFPVAGN